jgi:hypothetical protein
MVVPWNAAWTGEQQYEVRPCRYAFGHKAIWQKHAPGVGKPIFASPHMVRQRMSIAKFICTVCGKPTELNDRWWFQHGDIAEGFWITAEAPVHKSCGEVAQTMCPHLRDTKKIFEPFPMRHVRVMGAIIDPAEVGKSLGLNLPDVHVSPVVGHMKFGWPVDKFKIIDVSTGEPPHDPNPR